MKKLLTNREIAGMLFYKIDERTRIKVNSSVLFQKTGQGARHYQAPRSFLRWVFG